MSKINFFIHLSVIYMLQTINLTFNLCHSLIHPFFNSFLLFLIDFSDPVSLKLPPEVEEIMGRCGIAN